MGIGASISESMETTQRKMMGEQMEKQWKMQKKAQERMRRQMITFQMAMARERCYWMGAGWAGLVLGVIGKTVKTKQFPALSVPPLFVATMILAYQVDFAFYTKANRVNAMAKEIMNDESYWFVPLEVDPDKIK